MGSITDAVDVAGVLCGCAVGLAALLLCAWWMWARFTRPGGQHSNLDEHTSVARFQHDARPTEVPPPASGRSRTSQAGQPTRGCTDDSVQPILAPSLAPPRAVHRAAVVAAFFDSPTGRDLPVVSCPLPRTPAGWAPRRGDLGAASAAHVSDV